MATKTLLLLLTTISLTNTGSASMEEEGKMKQQTGNNTVSLTHAGKDDQKPHPYKPEEGTFIGFDEKRDVALFMPKQQPSTFFQRIMNLIKK